MNDPSNNQLDELLTRAIARLREVTPERPPRELVNLTIDRLHSLEASTGLSIAPARSVRVARRRKILRAAGYSAIAAATVFFAVLAGWLILFDRTAIPAFAEVIQQVANATSVTFISDSTLRNDVTHEVIVKEHVKWYVQGQRIRMEDVGGTTALIVDRDQQRHAKLNLTRKTATAGPLNEEVAEMIANPISQIQQLKAGDAKLVGDEVLDGRTVQLYQLDKVVFLLMGGKGTTKVWVDPQTQLPMKIVIEPKKRNDRSGYTEITKFQWNKKLDESLFRVPKNYAMIDAKRWMMERRKGTQDRN